MKLLALLLTFIFCVTNQSHGKNDSDGYRLMSYEEVWVKQLYTGENWINDSKLVYVFSPEGNLLSKTKYLWIKDEWSEYKRLTYKFDKNNNNIEESIYGLRYSVWINFVKLEYEYNDRNLEIQKTEYDWYDDSLHIAFQFKSNYDESGKLIAKYQSGLGETGWIPNFKTTYFYDESGRETEELYQTNFDNTTSNIDRKLTKYKDDTTQVTFQGWNMDYWFNSTRELTIKDKNDNSEMVISQYPKDSIWINSTLKINKYNDYDSLIYKEDLVYRLDSLVPREKYFYNFSDKKRVSELEQVFHIKWNDLYRSELDTNWGYTNKEIITNTKINFVETEKTIVKFSYILNKDADVRIYIANNADEEIIELHQDKQLRDRYTFEFDVSDFLLGEYYLVFDTSGIKGKIKLPQK